MLPCSARIPDAPAAAMPAAMRAVSGSSRIRRAAAKAAPMPHVTPVCDQAISPLAGATEMALERRHTTSMPSMNAANASARVTGCVSATASTAPRTGPLGCTIASAWVSSNALVEHESVLMNAAVRASVRCERPMSVTCAPPAKGCSAAQALLTASWCEPPSAQPMMLTRLRIPSPRTFSGIASIFVSRTKRTRSAVTWGSASLIYRNSSCCQGDRRPHPSIANRAGHLRSVLAMQPRMEIVGPGYGLGLEQADLVHGLGDHERSVGCDGEGDLAGSADDADNVRSRERRGLPLRVGASRYLAVLCDELRGLFERRQDRLVGLRVRLHPALGGPERVQSVGATQHLVGGHELARVAGRDHLVIVGHDCRIVLHLHLARAQRLDRHGVRHGDRQRIELETRVPPPLAGSGEIEEQRLHGDLDG